MHNVPAVSGNTHKLNKKSREPWAIAGLKLDGDMSLIDLAAFAAPAAIKDKVDYLLHDFEQFDVLVRIVWLQLVIPLAPAGARLGVDIPSLSRVEHLLAIPLMSFS